MNNTINAGFSLNVEVEKLDGGFISNITGKRRIYKNALDIDEAIDIKRVLGDVEENEYVLNIHLFPKNGELEIHTNDILDGQENLLEKAKDAGIIQEAEKFNPYGNMPKEDDLTAPIVVTAKNAYSSAKLKSINWQELHDQLPMTVPEKAIICNFNKTSMYSLSAKMLKGEAKFQLPTTRIAATILAQFYERNLGVRNTTKDKFDAILSELRELELLTGKGSHIKSKDVSLVIGKIRRLII